MAPAVEALGVVKRYGRRTALDRVDLRVDEGTVHGLLGPNGAGKTTLLRVLAAAERPTRGTVRVAGIDVGRDPDAVRRIVGVVPQRLALYADLTPREALVQTGRLYGLERSAARDRAAELLDLVGLAGRASDRTATLSGGMRHRLNLAAGLVHDPDVLLLDEPTTGLDPGARARIWSTLETLETDRSVVLSTHDLDEARRLADRVTLLDAGTVVAAGAWDDVADRLPETFGEVAT